LKLRQKKAEAGKGDIALDSTSEYEDKALEEPHHNEKRHNVSSQTYDVMPHSQRGSLRTGSVVGHFESVTPDKEGSSLAAAPDECHEHENSKFGETTGWTNDPATWPRVMNRNVRGYLIKIGPSTFTTEFSPETRVAGRF